MPDGLLGDIEIHLWHLTHGTLAYTGMEVLPSFYAWSVQYTTAEQRAAYLEEYAERLKNIENAKPMFFHPLADFGADWRLKPEIEPKTVGQRRL
jgi:NAD(P)H dehydrogenase (quinone)